MTTVGIINYGAGNIRSIENAFDHIGARTQLVSAEADFDQVTHLVLPGVGSFAFCRRRLEESGLVPKLEDWALAQKKPLLGICVGMQLLAQYSEEHGRHEGLGWIEGRVLALSEGDRRARVPHVGWNDITFATDFGRFAEGSQIDFYFDHSYALFDADPGQIVASCDHGAQFTVLVQRDNIVASQFHPEKSQDAGLDLIRGFLEGGTC
jgi:glutamine amidotransferase